MYSTVYRVSVKKIFTGDSGGILFETLLLFYTIITFHDLSWLKTISMSVGKLFLLLFTDLMNTTSQTEVRPHTEAKRRSLIGTRYAYTCIHLPLSAVPMHVTRSDLLPLWGLPSDGDVNESCLLLYHMTNFNLYIHFRTKIVCNSIFFPQKRKSSQIPIVYRSFKIISF